MSGRCRRLQRSKLLRTWMAYGRDLPFVTATFRPITELRKSIQTLLEADFQNSKSVRLEAANLYEAKCTFGELK